jgi:8-oxo-dGTP pyrophosphatase MutT (NUDIX family)
VSELVALVDPRGQVIGSAPRHVVRRDNLPHAATAVLVRNSGGEIYVHRRSTEKDWAPGFHDAAAGGVMRYAEEPVASAARELAEELGISGATLRPLGTAWYADDQTRCLEHCFETVWDGDVVFADAEVVSGEWMSLPTLDARLASPDWAFVPDTRALLTKLAVAGTGDYAALARLRAG